ncbi:MAG TPA: holo-ACP synthase [Roseiflexaceae bacterium]|jgi:holo-[acyl-carrier protein] synthase|nr:holo-ACP synthase [Roseiflexaceae bacterium]
MLFNGVDLVEISRIERAVTRWGDRFLQRVFTPAERAACQNRMASLAARWAAKEATAKMLGVGLRGLGGSSRHTDRDAVAWTDMEITNDDRGRPLLALSGRAAARATALGLTEWAVSLSHSHDLAIASVVGIADNTVAKL